MDLLLLETDFPRRRRIPGRFRPLRHRHRGAAQAAGVQGVSGLRGRLPGKAAALDKAVELALIDGYCVGSITPQQMRTWLNVHRRESRRDWTCRQDVLSDE